MASNEEIIKKRLLVCGLLEWPKTEPLKPAYKLNLKHSINTL